MGNKKIIASFELSLIIISAFAFPYMIADTSEMFEKFDEEYKQILEDKNLVSDGMQTEGISFEKIIILLLKELKEPIIPIVSAEELPSDMGCCEIDEDGIECSTIERQYCDEDAGTFKDFVSCADSPQEECIRGCCYNVATGVYEEGVYNHSCSDDWASGICSSFSASEPGCCNLGTIFRYVTHRECEILSASANIDPLRWDDSIGGLECSENAKNYEEGACLAGDGGCTFGTEEACSDGDFRERILCSSEDLDSWCSMSEDTKCKPGRSEVYFIDTCGNFANVYDENKVGVQTYWNNVAEPSCTIDSSNEDTCGNCQSEEGLICSSVINENDRMDSGDYYCSDTSCEYTYANDETEIFDNGEKWCDFDGVIGSGSDTVGSKHWLYYCNRGVVEPLGCDDYRQKICVESEENGFSYAVCKRNNWRECFMFNMDDEDDAMTRCDETEGCFSKEFIVDDYFGFSACLPEYPGGTNLGGDGSGSCGLAKGLTCTIYREPKLAITAKCSIPEDNNLNCLSEEFAEKMNEFCMSLGDCGGAANFDGAYTKNFDIDTTIPENDDGTWKEGNAKETFSDESGLIALANYPGKQNASVDYSELLIAEGFSIDMDEYDAGGMGWALAGIIGAIGGGVGQAVSGLTVTSLFGAMGIAAAGAAAGAAVGYSFAIAFGFSPGATALLTVGAGAMAGAALAMLLLGSNPIGWAILGFGTVLSIIGSLAGFNQPECEPINVTFDCQAWSASTNVDSCEACNEDPILKPCNEYRCASLGACDFIEERDGEYDVCVESINDGDPIMIRPLLGTLSPDSMEYVEDSDEMTGFSINPEEEGEDCIDAYELLMFGVNTSKRAKCKYGAWDEPFDEMSEFGIQGWNFEHKVVIPIWNANRGPEDVEAWTEDTSIHIKCRDHHGNENVPGYEVKFCINGGNDYAYPRILGADPVDDSFIGFDSSEKAVRIFTDKPANCSWSLSDVAYSEMTEEMECSHTFEFFDGNMVFPCEDDFDTSGDENTYYVRCTDHPYDNTMPSSYVYTLKKPEKRIEIVSIEPYEDIKITTDITPIELVVKTSGGGDYHNCLYSFLNYEIMFPITTYAHTTDRIHSTLLSYVSIGTHTIRINCSDETGDIASDNVTFKVEEHDKSLPELTRVWQSGSMLHVVTDRTSECRYTDTGCSYSWDDEDVESAGEGEDHTINVVAGKTYYIKCKTEYSTLPSDCLVQVQAV